MRRFSRDMHRRVVVAVFFLSLVFASQNTKQASAPIFGQDDDLVPTAIAKPVLPPLSARQESGPKRMLRRLLSPSVKDPLKLDDPSQASELLVRSGVGAAIGAIFAAIALQNEADYSSTGSSASAVGHSVGHDHAPIVNFAIGAAVGSLSYFLGRISNQQTDDDGINKFFLGGTVAALITLFQPLVTKEAVDATIFLDLGNGRSREPRHGHLFGAMKNRVLRALTPFKRFVKDTEEDAECPCDVVEIHLSQFTSLFHARTELQVSALEISHSLRVPKELAEALVDQVPEETPEALFKFLAGSSDVLKFRTLEEAIKRLCPSCDAATLACKIMTAASGHITEHMCKFLYYVGAQKRSDVKTRADLADSLIVLPSDKDMIRVDQLFQMVSDNNGVITPASVMAYYNRFVCSERSAIQTEPLVAPFVNGRGLHGIFDAVLRAFESECVVQEGNNEGESMSN